MPFEDEPVLGHGTNDIDSGVDPGPPLPERIRDLVTSQHYAVLCTHGEGHAYGSLVAFAFSDDLRIAVFATPRATRKYRLLSEHDRIALLVDNRPDHREDMMRVEAVTATGHARELEPGAELAECSRMLVARHPQLATFVAADSSAVFKVDVFRFLHVSRFQEVRQWVPSPR